MKIKASGGYLFPDRLYFHSCHGFNAEQPSLGPTELREEEYIFWLVENHQSGARKGGQKNTQSS